MQPATARGDERSAASPTCPLYACVPARGPQISVSRKNGRRPSGREAASLERVPGRRRRVFEITDIGPKTQPQAGANGRENDILVLLKGYTDAAHEIGRTVDASEALENLRWICKVVDERERFRARRAEIVADRRTLPVHFLCRIHFCVKRAFSVPQARDDRPARVFTKDVAGRAAVALERVLHHFRQPFRHAAEETMSLVEDLARRIGCALAWRRSAGTVDWLAPLRRRLRRRRAVRLAVARVVVRRRHVGVLRRIRAITLRRRACAAALPRIGAVLLA
ncbi:hypothetical protein T281_05565 [Rhodomicrobium udaipurense JA643]|nr:hypothetical protein T281_05565 [Rhodomicrobium udaipurense JA643]